MKRAILTAAAVVAAAAVITVAGLPEAPGSTAVHDPDRPAGHASVQQALERAVAEYGAPGAIAAVREGADQWFGSAGAADTRTGRPRTPQQRFRIGSTSKAFTATVVLQLAGEEQLDLDDSVERWLPGLLQGNGYDGSRITIRQLLNHTSGIFAYTNDPDFFSRGVGDAWYEHRYDRYTPEQLVEIALRHPPYGSPGERFTYSNTNYILAAMIVERATGNSFGTELHQRVIRPLKLTGTYLPGDESHLRGPHPVHYSTLFAQDPEPTIHDATRMNQSFAWSAGGMVSTGSDLNRFLSALLGGQLLPDEQLSQMLTTVPTEGSGYIPDTEYGLGILAQTLSCGVTVWGHGGATYGSWSYTMGAADSSQFVTSQVNGDWSGLDPLHDVLNAAFCPAGAG